MTTETKATTSLGQTEIWVDKEGAEHLVDDMSVGYKANVVAFLECRAPRIVGRALAEAWIARTRRLLEPVPCVMCPPSAGGGLEPGPPPYPRTIHRWEHGVDHAPFDEDKHPDEMDAIVGHLPSMTNAEAVELIRRTPLVARLLDDIAAGRGGKDD